MRELDNNKDLLKLQKGFVKDNLFLYSKNEYLFIIKDDIRMFKVSFKRIVKTLYCSIENILQVLTDNINKVYLQDGLNDFKIYLVIIHSSHVFKIKLKEINEYIKIIHGEKLDNIISKQNEKINILLKKLEYYENKYPEVLTDDEFI